MKIKAIDLISIAVGAEMTFQRLLQNGCNVSLEYNAAIKLKKELYKVNWDEDAILKIEEL